MWRLRGTGGKAAEVSERPSYRRRAVLQARNGETLKQGPSGRKGHGGPGEKLSSRLHRTLTTTGS